LGASRFHQECHGNVNVRLFLAVQGVLKSSCAIGQDALDW
jgi:hypothetical protein